MRITKLHDKHGVHNKTKPSSSSSFLCKWLKLFHKKYMRRIKVGKRELKYSLGDSLTSWDTNTLKINRLKSILMQILTD